MSKEWEAEEMTFEDALVQIKQGLEAVSSAVVNGIVNFIGVTTGFWIPSWAIYLLLIAITLFGFWKWVHKMGIVVIALLGFFLLSLLMGFFSGV